MGPLHFSVTVNAIVAVGSEVVGVVLVDFGIMDLELDFSFGGYFSLELGATKERTSGRVVSMVDVTSGFL